MVGIHFLVVSTSIICDQLLLLVDEDSFSVVGGRNFLFLNVPPVDRSPLVSGLFLSGEEVAYSLSHHE